MRNFWGALYVLSVGFWVLAAAPAEDQVSRGRRVAHNASPKCQTCHNLAQGDRFRQTGSRAEARAWVRTPAKMFKKTGKRGKMPAYSKKAISDADLDALVEYLFDLDAQHK